MSELFGKIFGKDKDKDKHHHQSGSGKDKDKDKSSQNNGVENAGPATQSLSAKTTEFC